MKIAVAGTGYVGLSIATLLAQHNEVVAVDVVPEKVAAINDRKSPIRDEYIEKFFAEKGLNLRATTNTQDAYRDADYIVIAVPTNYDSQRNFFDTSLVEQVIFEAIECNPQATIVIKSTVPVGYTESLSKKIGTDRILFSPEFLRESSALYDNLYPSRIIVGHAKDNAESIVAAEKFAQILYK
jgi:UDPglucose 6-dehydrogenase